MGMRLQMLRALMEAHPDRAEKLRPHVEALELSIESQPAFCLQNVRTLFEAAHATIAPRLKVEFGRKDGFPDKMKAVIAALDFSIANHPEAEKINEHVSALVGSINDMAVALARLSNVPNMRHGGSLDWGTLESQHAAMLGGLCDALVSFLFDVAWRRPDVAGAAVEPKRYEEFAEFNASLDEAFGDVEVAGARFETSRVLYLLDKTRYESAFADWLAQEREPAEDAADEAVA